MPRLKLSAVVMAGVMTAAGAQGPAGAPPVTLRADAKLVVVDVVVTDKYQNRVHGLTKDDFTVTEGSARQTIRSFEEHSPERPGRSAQPVEPLPAGTFTNKEPPPHSAAVNVILMDALNTPTKDQPYLRSEIAKYLGEMKAGTSLAVFSLNSRLVMLQGFSSDPAVLKAALERRLPQRSVMLGDDAEKGSTPETITDTIEELGLDQYIPLKVQAILQSSEDREKAAETVNRSKLTLDGLNALARFLAGIPGRKNVIWFSGAFPVELVPRVSAKFSNNPDYDTFARSGDSEREFRETTNLMTKAQVAVYPVDSRGLEVSSVFNVESAAVGMRTPGRLNENESNFSADLQEEHSTMRRLAQDTGGRAWIHSNDFRGAIESAVEDGVTYYTLSYTPTDTKWRGDLRRISVKLDRAGYSLSYRHGYYADDPNSATSALIKRREGSGGEDRGRLDESDLLRMMGHGMPAATQVLYQVSLRKVAGEAEDEVTRGSVTALHGFASAKGPFRRYRVGFQVDPATVRMEQRQDGRLSGMLEFAAWVLDADGKRVATLSRQMEVEADAEQYKHLTGQTIHFEMEVSVPVKGQYSVRTGVLDIRSRQVGAMEIAVEAVEGLTPVPAVAGGRGLQARPQ